MKVLWISFIWPEPKSSAAGFRTLELIKVLQDHQHHVEVCSPCQENTHKDALTEMGIPTHKYQPNDSEFDEFIKAYTPDIVFFDRFMMEEQFSWRVKINCPQSIRVLDTIDLHFLRRARQKKILENEKAENCDLHSDDAIRENASIYRSDLSLIISEYENSLLHEKFNIPENLLSVLRYSYPGVSIDKDFESRKNFIIIGNFNHAPNVDAFKILNSFLWNKINSLLKSKGISNAELHLYGAYPTESLLQLDNQSTGFRVKGWAKDAIETISQYRINLAPLRFGAGIKGKISDGWVSGTPCVATSIAAEGMHLDFPFAGAICDAWDEFAEEAVSLYMDELKWNKANNDAKKIIQELYSPAKNHESFIQILNTLVQEKESRRDKNFIGKMLWYEQFRSTEFFSRWIEEKNKHCIK